MTPWSLASLRTLKLRSARPRVAAMAATPNATGSAPIVSPPIAVASSGMTDSAASATSTMPSGRQAVCLVSRNHELRAPDLSVNVAALDGVGEHVVAERGERGGQRRQARHRPTLSTPVASRLDVPDRRPPHLHRAPAGRDLRRPPRRRHAGRAARLRRVLPQRPLPGDGRRARGRRAARADRRLDDARRPRPRHDDDPPRHARHVGDVPPARPAGDHRRRGRPDVRRSRRARPRRRVVRARARRPTASRSRRSASASTASRSSWR